MSPTLPPCFKEVKNKAKTGKDPDNENENEKGKKSKKRKTDQDGKQQRKQGGQHSNSEMTVKNEHQCEEFKLKEGKRWSIFKAAGNSDHVQLNGCQCAHAGIPAAPVFWTARTRPVT